MELACFLKFPQKQDLDYISRSLISITILIECADTIIVEATHEDQKSRRGVYTKNGTSINGRPLYSSNSGQYIYKHNGWRVGLDTTSSGLKSDVSRHFCCKKIKIFHASNQKNLLQLNDSFHPLVFGLN